MLDIVNIAHPAFVLLGSFIAYGANLAWGLDPILAGIVFAPLFFVLGAGIHRIYDVSFAQRGTESLRGLAFFFGILFITEISLVLLFGADYRLVETRYSSTSLALGPIGIPLRLLVPFLVSVAMIMGIQAALDHSFLGRAIKAVA